MNKTLLFVLRLFCIAIVIAAVSGVKVANTDDMKRMMPRMESIVHFVPLTAERKLQATSGTYFKTAITNSNGGSKFRYPVLNSTGGPFGLGSYYSNGSREDGLAEYSISSSEKLNDFTVAFFFSYPLEKPIESAILSKTCQFSIQLTEGKYLEIRPFSSNSLSKFEPGVKVALPPQPTMENGWFGIVLFYESLKNLTIVEALSSSGQSTNLYSGSGFSLAAKTTGCSGGNLALGRSASPSSNVSSTFGETQGMDNEVELACVSLYNARIRVPELRNLVVACGADIPSLAAEISFNLVNLNDFVGYWSLMEPTKWWRYDRLEVWLDQARNVNEQFSTEFEGPYGGRVMVPKIVDKAMLENDIENPKGDYTVAFYFRGPCDQSTGILMIHNNLGIHCTKSAFYMHGIDVASNVQLAKYNSTNEWVFFAVSERGAYSKAYLAYVDKPLQEVYTSASNLRRHSPTETYSKLTVGQVTLKNETDLFLGNQSSIACLFVMTGGMVLAEIEELIEICKLSQMNTTTTKTTTSTSTTLTTTSKSMTASLPMPTVATVVAPKKESIESFIPWLAEPSDTYADTTDNILTKCTDFSNGRASPPPLIQGKSIPISAALKIQGLNGISNVDEVISVNAIFLLSWQVLTCPWSAATDISTGASDVQELKVVDPRQIWVPQTRFLNAAQSNVYMLDVKLGEDFLAIMSTKPVEKNRTFSFFWTREGSFDASCSLNLESFPFDTQTCSFTFSLVRHLQLIDFEHSDNLYVAEGAFRGTEWGIVSKNVTYNYDIFQGRQVGTVTYSLTLKRDPSYYIDNLVLPTLLISFLNLPAFAIPPDFGDRPMLTFYTVLSLTVAQSQVINYIPQKPQSTLLSTFVRNHLLFSIGCILYHIFVLWLAVSYYVAPRSLQTRMFRKQVSVIRVLDVIAVLVACCAYVAIAFAFWNIPAQN